MYGDASPVKIWRQRTGRCSDRFFRIVLPVRGPAPPELYGGRWWQMAGPYQLSFPPPAKTECDPADE
ncbi:hypothetical protein J6590_096179 [Homalodisca vitripennis]|nr:hypothetical protein J6590_082314 [Homalodisca vitripennis]KAG8294747.1 hypothetical protein J6590_096179 [Homalodisca vitripennis]